MSTPSEPFKIIALKAHAAPTMGQGSDWHHYVIAQGDNRIEGYRRGQTKAVTKAIEQMVDQMNERRSGQYAAPRGKPGPKPSAKDGKSNA